MNRPIDGRLGGVGRCLLHAGIVICAALWPDSLRASEDSYHRHQLQAGIEWANDCLANNSSDRSEFGICINSYLDSDRQEGIFIQNLSNAALMITARSLYDREWPGWAEASDPLQLLASSRMRRFLAMGIQILQDEKSDFEAFCDLAKRYVDCTKLPKRVEPQCWSFGCE